MLQVKCASNVFIMIIIIATPNADIYSGKGTVFDILLSSLECSGSAIVIQILQTTLKRKLSELKTLVYMIEISNAAAS